MGGWGVKEQVGRLGEGWFEFGLEASSLQTLGKGPGRRGAAQTLCEVLTVAPPPPFCSSVKKGKIGLLFTITQMDPFASWFRGTHFALF